MGGGGGICFYFLFFVLLGYILLPFEFEEVALIQNLKIFLHMTALNSRRYFFYRTLNTEDSK